MLILICCFSCLIFGMLLGIEKGKSIAKNNFIESKNSLTEEDYVLKIPKKGVKFKLTKRFNDIVIEEVNLEVTLFIKNKEYNLTYFDFIQIYNQFYERRDFYKSFPNSYFYDTSEDMLLNSLNN